MLWINIKQERGIWEMWVWGGLFSFYFINFYLLEGQNKRDNPSTASFAKYISSGWARLKPWPSMFPGDDGDQIVQPTEKVIYKNKVLEHRRTL